MITSAGVVLAATFAALGVLPILFLAQIAFIVAFGVLLDTIDRPLAVRPVGVVPDRRADLVAEQARAAAPIMPARNRSRAEPERVPASR